jgi:rfaE bifunctional protein kinase chain/domain
MLVNFESLFSQMSDIRLAVIGDVMLDSYIWGQVERISPEAPVPVVTLSKKENRLGGAGNVALNAASLGSQVYLLSVLGEDNAADEMIDLLNENRIKVDYLMQNGQRITTTKTRIISRNQHILRLDNEITDDLPQNIEEKFINHVALFIDQVQPHVLIFEDYNKGVITETVIKRVIELCKSRNIFTAVDPKKKNFFAYQGVDIFKPNLKEVREALLIHSEEVSLSGMENIHQLLKAKLNHEISFITLSEKGVFYQDHNTSALLPTHVRKIADVSGAGDTVIAVASLVYAITKDPRLMAQVANLAGGLVCEEVGTVSINKEKLLKECSTLSA